MATQSSNTTLQLLTVSPRDNYLDMKGNKLPTYQQVLLCFLAHLKRARKEDNSRQQKYVYKKEYIGKDQVVFQYGKANIHTSNTFICSRILKLYREYCKVRKLTSKRRNKTGSSSYKIQ